MKCNGFNSDDYRYFRNIKDGSIVKYSRENLKKFLLGKNFHLRIRDSIEDYDIKEFDLDRPFDLIEYVASQPSLVFKHDGYLDLHFEKGEYCLITDWLLGKLSSDEIILSTILTGPESIRQHNQKKLNMVDSDEVIDSDSLKNSFNVTSLITRNSVLISPGEIKSTYQFNRGISFKIRFKKGEVWSLTNPAIAFILLNQCFISTMYDCEEILGFEQEKIFCEEYKDNITNQNLRYYQIKENVKINSLYDLIGDGLTLRTRYNGYDSTVAYRNGNLQFCKCNPNNYNQDGSFKYFYVEFFDDRRDITMEREILKIADRLPKKEAIVRYKEDLEAYKLYLKQQEALEYVNKHKARYKKGANRNMTPIEFMESEQARERKDLGRRLIKSLNKRISDLKQTCI